MMLHLFKTPVFVVRNTLKFFGIDLFTCTFCFPNTDHVIILRRFGPFFSSLKIVHADIFMLACALFNEHNKGPILLSIITWFGLGKQNVKVKRVYWKSLWGICVKCFASLTQVYRFLISQPRIK